MKRKLLFSVLGLTCFFTQVSMAQTAVNSGCFSDKYNLQLEAENPQVKTNKAGMETQIRQYISQHQNLRRASGTVLKIPVVIHVVTETGCNGISKAQILNGLEILNKDFRRQNADTANTRAIFKPYAADTEIEFVLARKTPNGQPTDGIERISSPTAKGAANRDDVKIAAPAWPTDKYFNIWLVENIYDAQIGMNILGYAQFPHVPPLNTFGVVLVHNVWGKQGAVLGSTANSSGHNATHEIAHCLYLQHIESTNCTDADLVPDTPPSIFGGPVGSACNFNQNTCSNDVALGLPQDMPDQIENYMSYSDFSCMNMFTMGQKMRMQASINLYPHLQNLVSPANATFTGIDSNPAPGINLGNPMPYFCVTSRRLCAGSTIIFTDKSFNATATSWEWTFPGGTPATSTLQNPVVTYNTPGKYAVSLKVANQNGVQMVTLADHITVVSTSNPINVSPSNYYVESFEEASFPVSATQNRTWEKATSSLAANPENWTRVSNAYSNISNFGGSNSLRLQNANLPAGTVSSLITPNFTVQGGLPSVVSLAIAYAPKNAQPAETLRLYYSHDCGVTWNGPIKTMTGSQLVTNGGAQVSNFVPTASEWRAENMVAQNAMAAVFGNTPHVMFKIEVTSNGGGNLYFDNFIIGTILGTKEAINNANLIKLFPNPLTAETGLNFNLNKAEKGSVKIFDLVGNVIYSGPEATFSAGKHTVLLADKLKTQSAGLYLVQLNLGGKLYNTKLLVQ